MRAASVNYAFYQPSASPATQNTAKETAKVVEIDYLLAFPGRILPDHTLWPVKALRDKIWLAITINPTKKAELQLLFADKRLASSKTLFERGKPELAFSTLTKAEKYLEEAVRASEENTKKGIDNSEFLLRLINASLKHRQVIEEILLIAPEDARPGIIQVEDYAKKAFKSVRDILNSKGLAVPENPFNGE